jgi:hypothetical protein
MECFKKILSTIQTSKCPVCLFVCPPVSLSPKAQDRFLIKLNFSDTCLFWPSLAHLRPGSSVSIVSGYGLDDRAIDVRSPAEAKNFSCSLCVQNGPAVHPASCPMGTGVLSPGLKRGRGVTLTTHPHLLPRSRMSRSYTSSPPKRIVACSGTVLVYFSVHLKDHFSRGT